MPFVVKLSVWFFGHFWNRFLLFLIAMIGFVFEFYPFPQVWESGFWKVRNVRLLGRKCPVSFHKISQSRQILLIYLSFGDWLKSDIWGNLTLPKYTKLGRTPQIVPFRILIISRNSMIFTPKSEVFFLVGSRFPNFIYKYFRRFYSQNATLLFQD